MTTYPLPTLACTLDSTGITAPSYADILASLQATYRGIYGSDAYLEADSQDGQLLAAFASAINDANAATIAVYNAFSPATAQGEGLSSVVKINGIKRRVPSHSTADLTIIGTAGTVITDGAVADSFGNQWALPATVTIPIGGSIVQTATCSVSGAITAAPDTITQIVNPTRGWQSATNVFSATVGTATEVDADLRRRQSASTALPAQSPLAGIIGAVADLDGVQRFAAYENDTGSPDANGLPAHSISMVVQGGDDTAIAQTIALKKTPGTATYGTTTETVIDPFGVPNVINFYRPTVKRVLVHVTIANLGAYVSTTDDVIKAALADYVTALAIGADVYLNKLVSAASLPGNPLGDSFNVTTMLAAFSPTSPGSSDLVVAFNQAASLLKADIILTVV